MRNGFSWDSIIMPLIISPSYRSQWVVPGNTGQTYDTHNQIHICASIYRWVSARKTLLQCVNNIVTSFLIYGACQSKGNLLPWCLILSQDIVTHLKTGRLYIQSTDPRLSNEFQWFPDGVIKWKHFPRYWPHKGQWRRALVFSLICAWTYGWANNRDAGD